MNIAERPLTLVLTGAESSGKTTLASDLAQHFAVPWVAEFARSYLAQPNFSNRQAAYTATDVEAIGRGQSAAEEAARQQTPGLLVVDTDLLVIMIWMRERYGEVPAWITRSIATSAHGPVERRYVLTTPEMAWEADPLREHPHARARLHMVYREALQQHGLRFIEVVGSPTQRLDAVRNWLREAE